MLSLFTRIVLPFSKVVSTVKWVSHKSIVGMVIYEHTFFGVYADYGSCMP